MTLKQFKEKYGVRSCEKCCANCRYGRDLCDDGIVECVHPDLEENFYSDLSGVCNAWSNMAETVESRDAGACLGDMAETVESRETRKD